MSVYAKLANVQRVLKCNKSQRNTFGDYNYRSCEDILEAAKPLCSEQGLALVLSDDIVLIGERYYVKATATLYDVENGENVINTAYARECQEKKKSDEAQITGAASSYARKYALNGLFCLDDTKDADTDENHTESENRAKAETQKPFVIKKNGKTAVLASNGKYYPLAEFNLEQLNKLVNDNRFAECHDEARKMMASKG